MLAAWGSKTEEGKQPVRGMFSFLFLFFRVCLWVPPALDAACEVFIASSCARTFWLWFMGSVAVAHGLSYAKACGILLPQPGIEPMSHFMQGRFLTTGPSGNS